MWTSVVCLKHLVVAGLSICLSASHGWAIDQAVTWVGGGGNNLWSNANNWNPNAAAPCNFGPVEFLVTIPANAGTIVFDAAMGSCELKSLTLGDNTTLQIAAGTTLSVTETAEICGIVSGIGGDFEATSSEKTAAVFSCNRARIAATAGSETRVDANNYSLLDLWSSASGTHNWNVMTVEGAGSVLDLSAAESINSGFSATGSFSTNNHRVNVSDGGTLLLTDVVEVVAPVRQHERLQFLFDGAASTIDLSGLATIASAQRGRTLFDLSNGVALNLPSLQSVSHTQFVAGAGSMIQDGPNPWSYDSLDLWSSASGTHTWNLITVTGADSYINFSALDSLQTGFSGSGSFSTNIQQIQALDGGKLVLSSVPELIAPVRSHERLQVFAIGSDSLIDLTSLHTISSKGLGRVRFEVAATGLSLPGLEVAGYADFVVVDAGTIDTNQLTQIADCRFAVSDASAFIKDANPATIVSPNLWSSASGTHNWNVMTVEGAGSVLDLSAAESINSGFSATGSFSTNNHRVNVSDGGTLLLTDVVEVVAPVRQHERLQFLFDGAASTIDLSGLATIASAQRGRTLFDLSNGVALNLPSLQSVSHTQFVAGAGSMIQDGPNPWSYDSLDLWSSASGTHTWNLITVTGADSYINFSALDSLQTGFSASGSFSTNIQQIQALDGGKLVLSSVPELIAPVRSHERIEFISEGLGSTIDLSSLTTTSSANAGSLRFTLDSGGSLTTGSWTNYAAPLTATLNNVDGLGESPPTTLHILGDLAGASNATITMQHANTNLQVAGSTLLGDSIDVSAPNGGTVAVGEDFLYSHANEDDLELGNATLHLNGSGDHDNPQILEVGGFDLDLLCSFGNDNFGLGELVIGSPDQPTVVHLRDDYNNCNTGGGNFEALYIYHENGLRIHAGSTLVINHLNVYLCDGQVRLKDLFPKGVTVIEYDEGFIELGESLCTLADLTCDGIVNGADLATLLASWGACEDCNDCPADFDCNCTVDGADLAILLSNWG
jgi:hypothetical protein